MKQLLKVRGYDVEVNIFEGGVVRGEVRYEAYVGNVAFAVNEPGFLVNDNEPAITLFFPPNAIGRQALRIADMTQIASEKAMEIESLIGQFSESQDTYLEALGSVVESHDEENIALYLALTPDHADKEAMAKALTIALKSPYFKSLGLKVSPLGDETFSDRLSAWGKNMYFGMMRAATVAGFRLSAGDDERKELVAFLAGFDPSESDDSGVSPVTRNTLKKLKDLRPEDGTNWNATGEDNARMTDLARELIDQLEIAIINEAYPSVAARLQLIETYIYQFFTKFDRNEAVITKKVSEASVSVTFSASPLDLKFTFAEQVSEVVGVPFDAMDQAWDYIEEATR